MGLAVPVDRDRGECILIRGVEEIRRARDVDEVRGLRSLRPIGAHGTTPRLRHVGQQRMTFVSMLFLSLSLAIHGLLASLMLGALERVAVHEPMPELVSTPVQLTSQY